MCITLHQINLWTLSNKFLLLKVKILFSWKITTHPSSILCKFNETVKIAIKIKVFTIKTKSYFIQKHNLHDCNFLHSDSLNDLFLLLISFFFLYLFYNILLNRKKYIFSLNKIESREFKLLFYYRIISKIVS